MTCTAPHQHRLRMRQLVFAGAAAVAMLALFDAARPDTTESLLASGSVRLVDQAFPQTPPSVIGGGGFAADDSSDQAQQQAQQEEQQAIQQLDEEENEMAEQQFEEGMQQAQMDEQQANDP
jgi:hypothetical protein